MALLTLPSVPVLYFVVPVYLEHLIKPNLKMQQTQRIVNFVLKCPCVVLESTPNITPFCQ